VLLPSIQRSPNSLAEFERTGKKDGKKKVRKKGTKRNDHKYAHISVIINSRIAYNLTMVIFLLAS